MYKVAILGYRVQGKSHHAPAFAKHPDCKIVAVCDMVEERARDGADTYRVPFYLDADEMLDKEKIDIVDVPTSEKYRFELVMNCLRRGKHVFTEKPLAGELRDPNVRPEHVAKARAMVDEWQKHDVAFGVCFGLHGDPNVRWAKQVIRNCEYGDLSTVLARCAVGSWNHLIDLCRFLAGDVDEVSAYANEGWRSRVAAVKFANGAVGTLVACADLALQYQIKWIARRGEVQIDDIGGTAWARSSSSYEYKVFNGQGSIEQGGYPALFTHHIAEFVDSIKEHRPFDADGWAGLRHMEIDAAISESILTGRPVKVDRYMPEKGRTIFSP
ncbi:MAG: Gfo/Idh/MocA family oxidoreductase [Armatimonadetes bacterium]|nr:Gfo/Idh/MocA family oxidoreductase [Armatimonadota bacterium]